MYHRSNGLSFDAALRDIQAAQPRDRVAAAEILASAQDDEQKTQAMDALAAAIGDPRPEVRSTACVSLAALEQPQAWEIIALCLTDSIPEVRQCAAIALGTLGNPAAFSALHDALREGPADVRYQAASSLAEVDSESAYQPLVDALDDTDPEVLGALALSLGAIGNAACADKLAHLLEHEVAGTRLDAAYALSQLGDRRATETLAAALPSDDGGWDAVGALEALGASSADSLATYLRSKKPDPRVALRAAGALLALAPSHPAHTEAQTALLDALRSRKLELRGLSLQELEKVGGRWSLTGLTTLLASFRGRSLREEIAETISAIESRSSET